MNVEIGTEAPIFLFWEYFLPIFGIFSLQCIGSHSVSDLMIKCLPQQWQHGLLRWRQLPAHRAPHCWATGLRRQHSRSLARLCLTNIFFQFPNIGTQFPPTFLYTVREGEFDYRVFKKNILDMMQHLGIRHWIAFHIIFHFLLCWK